MINKINKNLPIILSFLIILIWFIMDIIRDGQNIEKYYFILYYFIYSIVPLLLFLQFKLWCNLKNITANKKIFLILASLSSISIIAIIINHSLLNFIIFGLIFYCSFCAL